jgi:hypothetical protein
MSCHVHSTSFRRASILCASVLLSYISHLSSYAQATAAHYADLRARYGSPVVTLNLLRAREQRPRETLLRRELAIALSTINATVGPRGLVKSQSRSLGALWAVGTKG